MMRVGSLFAGYGGLDLAVEAVWPDTELAWVSEIDAAASRVLAHHWPDVPNLGDITVIDWARVAPVDVLTGGFPCQDVSTAGLRAGLTDGTRSGLWVHMAHAINALRPSLVVIENVRGLLSAHADSDVEPCPWCVGDTGAGDMRALGAVLADLADLGFDAEWGVFPASAVGAPHRRERVFIVAAARDAARVTGQGRSGSRRPGQPADVHTPGGADRLSAADTAGGSHGRAPIPDIEPSRATGHPDRPVTMLPTPVVNDMGAGKAVAYWDEWTAAMRGRHGNGNGHGASLSVEARRLLPTVKASNNENRQSDGCGPNLGGVDFGRYQPAVRLWGAILGRPAPPPVIDDRLSPRFVEWMMGLPDGWVCDVPGIPYTQQLRMLGNGVVPQQATEAILALTGRLHEAVAS